MAAPGVSCFSTGKASQRRRLAFRVVSPKRKTKAMIDVIVDQRFLGVVDCILDRLELLSELARDTARH
jgi:hypothetical protein